MSNLWKSQVTKLFSSMSSIYDIQDWNYSFPYVRNDIVRYAGNFLYSLKDIAENTDFSYENFGGFIITNERKPNFIWKPSFPVKYNTVNRIINTSFKEGALSLGYDGINSNSIEIEMNFSSRDDKEAAAICHFLDQRGGVESFYYTVGFPFNVSKLFICKEWQSTPSSLNINNITATFKQVFN